MPRWSSECSCGRAVDEPNGCDKLHCNHSSHSLPTPICHVNLIGEPGDGRRVMPGDAKWQTRMSGNHFGWRERVVILHRKLVTAPI